MLRLRVRYRVEGNSMKPILSPGDFVLVDPVAFTHSPPLPGAVVVAKHPYLSSIVIKRVSQVLEDGVFVVGDNSEASSDSHQFGRVNFKAILGRVTSRIS